MEFTEVIQKRYSCKRYSGESVPEKALDAVLAAGRLAPTAKNLQEQRIYVLQSPESLAMADRITPCRYGAPTVLVVAYDRDNVFTYPGGTRDSGAEDMAIVACHMMLAAANEGLGSCWINYFDPQQAAEELGLPDNEEPVLMLDLGFPGEGGGPLPNNSKRKPLSETVTFM